jgi:hypothetical protein
VAFLVALPLAGPAALGWAVPGALDSSVSCGTTSPLNNSCDAGLVRWARQNQANVVTLGFVGHIRITGQEIGGGGFVRWDCDAAGSASTTGCTGTTLRVPSVGNNVHVTCVASALERVFVRPVQEDPVLVLPVRVLPPAGPWGCEVASS